jgi:hypothetical protein
MCSRRLLSVSRAGTFASKYRVTPLCQATVFTPTDATKSTAASEGRQRTRCCSASLAVRRASARRRQRTRRRNRQARRPRRATRLCIGLEHWKSTRRRAEHVSRVDAANQRKLRSSARSGLRPKSATDQRAAQVSRSSGGTSLRRHRAAWSGGSVQGAPRPPHSAPAARAHRGATAQA